MSVFRVTLISFDPDNDQEKETFQKVLTEYFEVSADQIASVLANLPSILTENLSKNIAESSVKKLKELGAVVALEEIKASGGSSTQGDKSDDPLDFDFDFDESFSFEEKGQEEKKEEPAAIESEDSKKSSDDLSFDFTDEPGKPAEDLPQEFDFSFDEKAQEELTPAKEELAPAQDKEPVATNLPEKPIEKNTENTKDSSASPPTEPEKSKSTSTSKTKLKKQTISKKTQIAFVSSLAILLLATFYILDPLNLFKEQESSSSNVNSTMVEALLKEQQKILAPPAATPSLEPTPIPLEERYWESTIENEIATTSAKILTLGTEIKQIQLDITTPKPRKLTFSELAQNKLEPVWIEKADVKIVKKIEDAKAREEKEIAFKLQGNVRAFLGDSIGNERIFADIDIAGNYSKENDRIIGIWEIRYGPITNRLQDYNFVERLSKKEFAVYYKGRFEAVLTEKPKTYELSLESLQKMGVDINQVEIGGEGAPPAPPVE